MSKRIEELEKVAEILSIGIARERESIEYFTKAYSKCVVACTSKKVEEALSLILEQKKKHEAELRTQLHHIRLELMQMRGPRKIERSIVINAPSKKVFSLLTDRKRVPEWNKLIKESKVTSEKATGVGSTVHYVGEAGGAQGEWDIETTEWEENKKYAWQTTSGDITMFTTWTLKPTNGGTQLTYTISYELPYSILGKILDKLRASKDIEKGMINGLQNLKRLLEK